MPEARPSFATPCRRLLPCNRCHTKLGMQSAGRCCFAATVARRGGAAEGGGRQRQLGRHGSRTGDRHIPQASAATIQQRPQLGARCLARCRAGRCSRQGRLLVRRTQGVPCVRPRVCQATQASLEAGVELHEEGQGGSGGAPGAGGHRLCQRVRQLALHRKDLRCGAGRAGRGAGMPGAQGTRPTKCSAVSAKAAALRWVSLRFGCIQGRCQSQHTFCSSS